MPHPSFPVRTGGQLIVDSLAAQGVDHVFCVPGESYLAVLDALHDVGRAGSRPGGRAACPCLLRSRFECFFDVDLPLLDLRARLNEGERRRVLWRLRRLR